MELQKGGGGKEMVTNNHTLNTVEDVVNYYSNVSNLEEQKSKLNPSNWQYFNCMTAGFKKDVGDHHELGWDNMTEEYYSNLKDLPCILPVTRKSTEAVFHLYVVQAENRDELIKYIASKGIQLGIHYPFPVHLQPTYKDKIKTSKSLRITEDITKKIFSLPMYPELSKNDVNKVVSLLKKSLG